MIILWSIMIFVIILIGLNILDTYLNGRDDRDELFDDEDMD